MSQPTNPEQLSIISIEPIKGTNDFIIHENPLQAAYRVMEMARNMREVRPPPKPADDSKKGD